MNCARHSVSILAMNPILHDFCADMIKINGGSKFTDDLRKIESNY